MKNKLFFVFIILCFAFSASAQLHRFPIKRVEGTTQKSRSESATGRTKDLPPLTLPFWDDFSISYKDLYPDISRWENSFSVWVNNGMGINPPTLNVVTFDGLDSAGLAYNPNDILVNGFTDSLVSRKIDISETAIINPVSVTERNSVYLSFFYQWQGNGEAPDPSDYLQLEFRNDLNKWDVVMIIKPKASFKRDVFYDTIVKVNGDQFFHDAFQFRLKSFGRQSGPYDTWNIDYVYLNKNRNINDLSFPDQAIASSLTSLFKNNYRSIPYLHFLNDPSLVKPKYDIYNLRKDPPDVLTYLTEGTFVNYKDSIPSKIFISNLGGTDTTGINDDGTGTIFPFEKRTASLKYLPNINDPNQFNPNADSVFIDLKVRLFTGDYINHKTGGIADDYDLNYSPIDFRLNDTIRAKYALKDYYAYDDGRAEYAAGLIEAGNLVAYEFELPDDLSDSLALLNGFDIYFPPYGLTSNQTVDFFVYHDNNGKPGEQWLQILGRPISKKGANQFHSIEFLPSLQIDEKKFYIGWKEPVAGNVLVGLDISNDTGNKIFVNTSGTWYQNNEVTGSLMVRPVFGTGTVDPTTGIEDKVQFSIYPNPNKGTFFIDGQYDRIKILSVTGQEIQFQREAANNKTLITLHQPAGLYLLRCSVGNSAKTYKILVTR